MCDQLTSFSSILIKNITLKTCKNREREIHTRNWNHSKLTFWTKRKDNTLNRVCSVAKARDKINGNKLQTIMISNTENFMKDGYYEFKTRGQAQREQQSERSATSACPTDHSLKHQLQYEHLIETRKQIEIKKQKEFKL